MEESMKCSFLDLSDDFNNSLLCMSELISRLETLEENNIEKLQCIEAIRDNIDIMRSQIKDIKESCKDNESSIFKMSKGISDTFVMRDTKVLIVDDNEINNYVVEQMLKKFNIEVDVALNGESAINQFEKKDYDLILMDYLMPPGIDSVETVRRIRQLGDRGKKQLIIGLTANTIDEFKNGLNKYNVELIIFKPIKHQQMALILQKELADKIEKQ